MSALPLKADILGVEINVRQVPQADMPDGQTNTRPAVSCYPCGVYQIGEV
jgi:hypothetical protein